MFPRRIPIYTASLLYFLYDFHFQCTAFQSSPTFLIHRHTIGRIERTKTKRNVGRKYPLSKIELRLHWFDNNVFETSTVRDAVNDIISSGTSNPQVEAEILGDVSHILTDVAPFLQMSTLLYRICIFIGRIFAMESDYLPDQFIMKDDLLFQLPLLTLSATLAWNSMMPYLKAFYVKTTPLDDIVYRQLFEPVGVNFIQFRSMVATCIDWEILDPGSQIVCENEDPSAEGPVYLYWLYEGDVIGAYEGNLWTHIERHSGKSIDDPSAVGLLSDMKFLYSLDLKEKKKKNSNAVVIKYPMATFHVGQMGATLMRIESDALYELMEHDEHLEASIRQLLLKSLQRKVGLLLRSHSQPKPQADLPLEMEQYFEFSELEM
jgi:hypothetical protein